MTALWALPVAVVVTLVATPAAAAIARRTDFYDHPVGYKGHKNPTPYLGGAAVFIGFVVGALAPSLPLRQFTPLVLCAAGLLVLGTIDDRVTVRPVLRVLAEVGVAVVLSLTGHGWEVFGSPFADFALTVAWIVGLVNAFNLMDNLDGAAATVAGVCAATAAALALATGAPSLAAVALAVAGACAGFLCHNLAHPARIFLGDGGSMLLGVLAAGLSIDAVSHLGLGASALFGGAMLVGLPILDTTLVVVSRTREQISLAQAGRDHLTHRILTRLGSPRRVALVLGIAQGLLGALVLAGGSLGSRYLAVLAGLCVVGGLATIALLETPGWKPSRKPVEPPLADEFGSSQPSPVPAGLAAGSGARPGRGTALKPGHVAGDFASSDHVAK